MNNNKQYLQQRIRLILAGFVFALLISGITAFPLHWEINLLSRFISILPDALANFIQSVATAINYNALHFPFMQYGTDWLAFAHIVIAIAFIGPLREPVRNIWVIQFGMISCVLVLPLAFICGHIRGIPFLWQLVDCSFGVIGFFPLLWVHRLIKKLAQLTPYTIHHEKIN